MWWKELKGVLVEGVWRGQWMVTYRTLGIDGPDISDEGGK